MIFLYSGELQAIQAEVRVNVTRLFICDFAFSRENLCSTINI